MDGLGLLRAANVSVWVEAFGALGRAPDPDLIGGVRLASPTATSHAAEIAHLSSVGLRDAETAYLTMLVSDAKRAASRLRSRYDATGGEDGLVELPRLPGAAWDVSTIVALAAKARRAADSPNVLVGIPGTDAGLVAVEELTFRGIGTAVDGVYCAERYARAAGAYVRGLERRLADGLPLDAVASVAWIRLAALRERIDRLLTPGSPLHGAVAFAVAQSVYAAGNRRFSGRRWQRLVSSGARPLRTAFCAVGDVRAVGRLALPGAVIAIGAHAVEELCAAEAVEPAEVDETEVAWVLQEAAAAGVPLGALAAELRCAIDEQAAFGYQTSLAAIADRLHSPRGVATSTSPAEACR